MNENYFPGTSIGPEKRDSLNYTERAKARKTMEVICTPDSQLSAANATAGFLVGKGNLCRVFGVSGSSVVAFGPSTIALPTTSTATGALMSAACQVFVASDDYIRTTSDVTRVEVILESDAV